MPDTPPDAPLGVLLYEAIDRLRDAESMFRNRLRVRLGLGGSDLRAVEFIARAEVQHTIARSGELAVALAVTSAATSIIVSRLAARGIVDRHIDADDRRSKILTLTARAHADLDAAYGELPGRVRELVDGLTTRDTHRITRLAHDIRALLDATEPSSRS